MKGRMLRAVAMAACALATGCVAQEAPWLRARQEDLRWWREARFGLFVHWGPVSLKGTEISWSRGAGLGELLEAARVRRASWRGRREPSARPVVLSPDLVRQPRFTEAPERKQPVPASSASGLMQGCLRAAGPLESGTRRAAAAETLIATVPE